VTVRPIRESDVADAALILRALDSELTVTALESRLRKTLASPDHRVWVFESNGKIAALCHAFIRPALEKPVEVVVQSIAVDPAVRKGGIGRALMRQAEAWARETGHASVALHTRNAAPFYVRLGYHEVAQTGLMRKSVT